MWAIAWLACTPGASVVAPSRVVVRENPTGPLSPYVDVDAPEGAVVEVVLTGPDGVAFPRPAVWDGVQQVAWAWGLTPDAAYDIAVRIDGVDQAPVRYVTAALPHTPPEAEVIVDEAGRSEGITLVPALVDGELLFVGYDLAGRVVWYYEAAPQDGPGTPTIRQLPGGDLLVGVQGEVRRIHPNGEIVWAREIGYHHDVLLTRDEHLVYLTNRVERYAIPALDNEVHNVLIDGVMEDDADGKRIAEWWASDDLDVTRFDTPLSLSYEAGNDGLDWSHANALAFRADGSLLVSLRHQNWIVVLDWAARKKKWVLGADGDFAIDDASDWFSGQHAPAPLPDGGMWVYDNGVDRDPQSTRVTRYAIDEPNGTVQAVAGFSLPIFTLHAGDVDVLSEDRLLVTVGEPVTQLHPPRVFEATPDGEVLWQLDVLGGPIYRTERIMGF